MQTKKKYNQYGNVAVLAAQKQGNPIDAWEKAAQQEIESESSRKKGCPRSAFLGLCEEGLVNNFQKGKYMQKDSLNKKYAIHAIKLLQQKPELANENNASTKLWELLNLCDKSHNGQMDVVLALWKEHQISY